MIAKAWNVNTDLIRRFNNRGILFNMQSTTVYFNIYHASAPIFRTGMLVFRRYTPGVTGKHFLSDEKLIFMRITDWTALMFNMFNKIITKVLNKTLYRHRRRFTKGTNSVPGNLSGDTR